MILYKPRDLFCQEFGDGRSGRYNGKLKSGDGASSTQFCSIALGSFSFYRIFLRKKRLVRMNFHSVNGLVESLFSSDGYFLKNCGSFEKEKKFEKEGNAFIILVQDQTLGTARFTNVPSPHPSPVFRLVCSRFFATSPSCSILIIDSDFNTARLCAFYIMLEQFPF